MKEKTNNKNFLASIIKSSVYAVSITLIAILIFALLIRFANIPDSVITPVNQVIKVISLLIGCFIGLKRSNKGFLKGILIGLFYVILSFIIFSIISGSFSFGWGNVLDIVFSMLIGGISGVIAVNFKK